MRYIAYPPKINVSSDPARLALLHAIRQADLSPPLGYPGGPCQVLDRIQSEVRGPRERERLLSQVEVGGDLTNKDTALIYDRENEGRAKGSPFKHVLLTHHAQYRMDLRGITVLDVKLALKNFHTQYNKNPLRWERQIQTSQDFYWRDPKTGLSLVFLVASYGGKDKAAQIISAWWGASEPRGKSVSRYECAPFEGWATPSPDRVASRYHGAGAKDLLKWIVQPFEIIVKHHKEFVEGPIDDASDAILRDLAPDLVRGIIEREVDEDVDEFLEGAQKGRFEALAGYNKDPGSNISQDYKAGYAWGFANSRRWDGRDLPSNVKRRVVREQLEEFRGEITEQVVIAAMEKAWATVSPREIFKTVMRAVKQHGWKIGLVYGIGEIIENFVIPAALTAITGVPVPPGSTGWIPLNDIVFAVIVKRLGGASAVDEFEEDGHLDWYEARYGPVRVASSRGDCYEANGRFFMNETLIQGSDSSMRLVQGEVTGQGSLEGVKYGHCWIEDGNTVIDKSNGRNLRIPKVLYYALGNIGDNVHKYTPEQFREKIIESGHWGPWDLKTSTGY